MSVVVGVALCAFGGLLVVAGVRRLGTAVSLSRTDAVSLRDVPRTDGPVEFEGQARSLADEDPLEAPFSGEDALCCAVWMETGDRHRTDVDGAEVLESKEPETYRNTEQSWLLAESDEFEQPFVVADGGARVAVDPTDADLDITGHMGETVLTVDAGESLPDEIHGRLERLDRAGITFDTAVETWTRDDERVKYREARLEPGDPVHVAGGAVTHVPDEWGSNVDATVGAPETDDRFLISQGTESSVVRKHFVQFITGVVAGTILLVLGLSAFGVAIPV
jgi:hypothetical protein